MNLKKNVLDLLRAMSGPNFCIATNDVFLVKITTKLAKPSGVTGEDPDLSQISVISLSAVSAPMLKSVPGTLLEMVAGSTT